MRIVLPNPAHARVIQHDPMRRAARRLRPAALLAAVALLAGCGDPDTHGAKILRYDIDSRFANATLHQTAIAPAGGAQGRPLLVFLHGRGDNGNESNVNSAFLDALAALGDQAPAVVFPDGHEHSYWHARGDGDWAAYVLREVIPEAVKRLHADPKRVAIGGISMGGFGAFDVARLAPARFCAVGGHSAAMWLTGGETAPGAFDDAEDFARNDVVGIARAQGRGAWGRAQLWLDGGDADPFRAADQALADALGIRMHVLRGAHERDYWHAHYGAYLRFYARALRDCR